jgi:hypothetical protein
VIQRFEGIEKTADEIFSLQQAQVNPFSLPPEVSSCEKYGGCPHRARCNLSIQEKVKALMNQGQARANGLLGAIQNVAPYVAGQDGAPAPQMQVPQGGPAGFQPPQQQPQPQYAPQAAPQPQYAPQQPQYAQQPQYEAPQQPQYAPQAQPQPQPQYQQPAPQYQQPQAQPQYQPAPQAQPQYQQPAPQYQQPTQPLYQQPAPQYAPEYAPTAPAAEAHMAKRPSARRANSPPNSPEGVDPNAAAAAHAAEQEAIAEKKKGRPRKVTKGETSLEQQAFLMGVQAGILRGAQPHALRTYGQMAAKAFFEEFPPTTNED